MHRLTMCSWQNTSLSNTGFWFNAWCNGKACPPLLLDTVAAKLEVVLELSSRVWGMA